MNKNKFLLFCTVIFLISKAVHGQNGDTLEIQRNGNGKITFASFKPNTIMTLQNSIPFLKSILTLNSNEDFKIINELTDDIGYTHKKVQQYYKGIKIEGYQYTLHGKNGLIETINGNYKPVTLSSVAPSISELQALSNALNYVGATV